MLHISVRKVGIISQTNSLFNIFVVENLRISTVAPQQSLPKPGVNYVSLPKSVGKLFFLQKKCFQKSLKTPLIPQSGMLTKLLVLNRGGGGGGVPSALISALQNSFGSSLNKRSPLQFTQKENAIQSSFNASFLCYIAQFFCWHNHKSFTGWIFLGWTTEIIWMPAENSQIVLQA